MDIKHKKTTNGNVFFFNKKDIIKNRIEIANIRIRMCLRLYPLKIKKGKNIIDTQKKRKKTTMV